LLRKRAGRCSTIVALAALAGVVTSAWQTCSVLRSGSTIDPANEARVLAEGISGTMNALAAGMVFSPLPLAATLALLMRARRLARLAR